MQMISTYSTQITKALTRALMVFALLVLMFAAFPEKAEAAGSGVQLGQTSLINDGKPHSWNDSGAAIRGWTSGSYILTEDSSTLYIDDLVYSSSSSGSSGIVTDKPLTLVASGKNSISCVNSGILIGDSNNYYGFGDLTLKARDTNSDSSVTVTSNDDAVYAARCYILSSKLIAKSTNPENGAYFSGRLIMTGGEFEATNIVAHAYNILLGTVRAQNNLTARKDTENSIISGGFITVGNQATFQGPLELTNASLLAGSVNLNSGFTQGSGRLLATNGDVIVSNGSYTGSGGVLAAAKAIKVNYEDMLLSGAAVSTTDGIVSVGKDLKITGGSLSSHKCGIEVSGNLNISGTGKITTILDNNDPDVQSSYQALAVRGKFISDGGDTRITAISGDALCVNGETIINGGTVTITNNTPKSAASSATFYGSVYLQGGKLTATSASQLSSLLNCLEDMQINNNAVLEATTEKQGIALSLNGEFRLNSGTATLNSNEFYALTAENVAITGGKLSMNGSPDVWYITKSPALAEDIWMSTPSDGRINDSGYHYILTKNGAYASQAVLQKVTSISVQTAPDETLYEYDTFDPSDLVINVKFADGTSAPLSYKSHKDMFSLSPTPQDSLSSGTHNVQVKCLGQTATFAVTVKALGKSGLSGAESFDAHQLSWTEADGAEYYRLYGKKKGESSFHLLSDDSRSAFRNNGLAVGETWEYYVVPARKATTGIEVIGAESNHVTLTTVLDAPVIKLSESTYDSVSLTWDKVSGAESYKVYRSSAQEGATPVELEATGESFIDTGLVTGREYSYYVKAAANSVLSDAGNTVKATPEFGGKTTLSVANSGGYELTWDAVDGATGYEIRRGRGSDGSRTLLTTTDASANSFKDDSADIYAVYNYTVVPVRVTEEGTFRGSESNVAAGQAMGKPAEPEPEVKPVEPVIVPPAKDEPSGTKFNLLQARSGKVTKKSIQIKWKKVSGAKKYLIYGNKCGTKYKYKKLLATSKTSINFTKVAGKKVTKGTYFKFLVYAVDSKGKVISTSKTVHVATKGGKVGNDKKVKTAAKKNKVTLKKGKSFKLRAKAIPASKKLKVRRHRKIAYETSNAKVAKVSSKGVIKATGKGTCCVYAYTQNGIFAKVRVTVK